MPFYPDQPEGPGFVPVGHPTGLRMEPNALEPPPPPRTPSPLEMPDSDIKPPEENGFFDFDTAGAGIGRTNMVFGTLASLSDHDYGPPDPNHNPLDFIQGTDAEQYWDRFLGSRNERETNAIIGQINREIDRAKLLEGAGWAGTTWQLIGGVFDLPTLLPGGVFYKAARAARSLNAVKTAASVGAAAGVATSVQEGFLHWQQYTRTLEESTYAVGGSIILGAILGAGISGVSSTALSRMARTLERDLKVPAHTVEDLFGEGGLREMERAARAPHAEPVGAAAAGKPPVELKGALGAEKAFAFQDPVLRTLNSPFNAAREVGTNLFETVLGLTRNAQGVTTAPIGGAVETRIKMKMADLGQAVRDLHEQFARYFYGKDYTPAAAARSEIANVLGTNAGKQTWKQFKDEIGKAMSAGDEHPIPEVAKGAKVARKLIDKHADDAIRYKLLDEEVVNAGRPSGKSSAKPKAQQAPEPPKTPDEALAEIGARVNEQAGLSPEQLDLRVRAGEMLDQLEKTLGQQGIIPQQVREQIIKGLVSDEPLYKELRDLLQRMADGAGVPGPDDLMAAIRGTLLPMDEPSRLARARAMGFDTKRIWYHGTKADFAAFDLDAVRATGEADIAIAFSDNPHLASAYAGAKAKSNPHSWRNLASADPGSVSGRDGGRVMPVYLRMTNPLEIVQKDWGTRGQNATLIAKAHAAGHDGIVFTFTHPNYGPNGLKEALVFDPANVRSTRAAFYPKEDSSSDLMAAIRAFHGSPHDFDRFSIDRMGTGEGTQVFGPGLYFAENPEVAVGYANIRRIRSYDPKSRVVLDGEELTVNPDAPSTKARIDAANKEIQALGYSPEAHLDLRNIARSVLEKHGGETSTKTPLSQQLERKYRVYKNYYPNDFAKAALSKEQQTSLDAAHYLENSRGSREAAISQLDAQIAKAQGELRKLTSIGSRRALREDIGRNTALANALRDGAEEKGTPWEEIISRLAEMEAKQPAAAELKKRLHAYENGQWEDDRFKSDWLRSDGWQELSAYQSLEDFERLHPGAAEEAADPKNRFEELGEAARGPGDVLIERGSATVDEAIAAAIRELRGMEASGRLTWESMMSGTDAPKGVYKVDLDVEQDHLLDWDKPLNAQSAYVQKALQAARLHGSSQVLDRLFGWLRTSKREKGRFGLHGPGTVHDLLNNASDKAALRQTLLDAGIPGVRYFDGWSRKSENGNRNYVIFDDSKVKIVAKNGEPVSDAERADFLASLSSHQSGPPPAGSLAEAHMMQAIGDEIRTMLPADVVARVERADFDLGNGNLANGLYDHANGLVRVSLSGGPEKALEIGRHEVIHALRRSNLFSDDEWAALVSHAKKTGVENEMRVQNPDTGEMVSTIPLYRAMYDRMLSGQGLRGADHQRAHGDFMDQELVAKMAESWEKGVSYGRFIDGLFDRARRMMEAVAKGLQKLGITTWDDWLERSQALRAQRDVLSGEVGSRGLKSGSVDPATGYQYAMSPETRAKLDELLGPEMVEKMFKDPSNIHPDIVRAAEILAQLEKRATAEVEKARVAPGGPDVPFTPKIADEVWDDKGQSYITRMYNRQKIAAQRAQFTRIITDYFESAQQRAAAVLSRLKNEIERGVAPEGDIAKDIEDLTTFTGLSRQDLEASADKVVGHILGAPEGRLLYDLPQAVRGPLKARTLRIPDKLIEDYLERDIEAILRYYTRTMVPDIEMTRMFGSLDMKDQIAKIMDEAVALAKAAPDEKTATEFNRAAQIAVRDLTAVADRLRGTYKLPEDPMAWGPRIARTVRTYNYLRLLGGMTLASLSDPMRTFMTQGLVSTLRDGWLPLIRSLQTVKLAGEEVKLAGTALDMVLDTRAMAIADIMDDYGRYSKFERALHTAQEQYGLITLMAPWNAAWKQFTGMIVMTNIIRAAKRMQAGKATAKDIERLAASSIDEPHARLIADLFDRHGSIEKGVYLPNTQAWDIADPNVRNALEAFRGAVVRDVDRTIVTPGQDKPLWMSTEVGKIVGQVKSFSVASIQRTLIAGLQERDAGVFAGAILMIGMGAVSEALKNVANREKQPEGAIQWAQQAIDRSGLLGYLFDVNHFAERATAGQIGISKLTGKEVTRYAGRNWADAVLGPTAGLIKDAFDVTNAVSRRVFKGEQMAESDVRAMRRMLPTQNLFYMSWLWKEIEKGMVSALGARPARQR